VIFLAADYKSFARLGTGAARDYLGCPTFRLFWRAVA